MISLLMRVSSLVFIGLFACDDSVVEIGVIEMASDPARIDVPSSLGRGESALVHVRTYGSMCMSVESTELVATEDGAEITPYDRREPGGCVLALIHFGHETHVRFDTPGTKTILVNGRRQPGDELVQKSFSLTVLE